MNNTIPNTWSDCKDNLKSKIPSALFNTFIEPLNPLELGSNQIDFHSPGSKGTVEHIESRYMPLICDFFQKTGYKGQVSLNQNIQNKHISHPKSKPFSLESQDTQNKIINKKNNLDSFLPSKSNKLMVESIMNLQGPRMIVLTGPSGSGKTHLSKALVERHKSNGKEARYLSLEEFLSEFSLACKRRDTVKWRKNLRSHSLLIFDDFHFLKSTAARSSEELQHLVDEFQNNGSSLIFTSTTPISQMKFSVELRSRMLSLPSVQLEYPQKSIREKILLQTLDKNELSLSPDLVSFISQKISRDIRLLKSAVDRLRPYLLQDKNNCKLSEDRLDKLLGDLYYKEKNIPAQHILRVISNFYQIKPHDITGSSRMKTETMARHLVAYICTDELGWGQKETAKLIGRKDHGTVIHARKKISDLLNKDLFFSNHLTQIKSELYNI